jgi:hypothetical protein
MGRSGVQGDLRGRDMTKFMYPINVPFVLGVQETFEVPISPDIPIYAEAAFCNAPAAGMFIVQESGLIYEHDPFNIQINWGVPFKRRTPILTKSNKDILTVQHTGFIPPGYMGGMKFTFMYRFTGTDA